MVRFKSRWLLFEFIPYSPENGTSYTASMGTITNKEIYNVLRDSIVANFGDTGWGAVGQSMSVKYFSQVTNMCIIRVARDHHRILWAALTLLNKINGRRCITNVIHVAGTMKHAQLAAVTHNRIVIARVRAEKPGAKTYDEFLETAAAEIQSLRD